jgi:hypothetical protein
MRIYTQCTLHVGWSNVKLSGHGHGVISQEEAGSRFSRSLASELQGLLHPVGLRSGWVVVLGGYPQHINEQPIPSSGGQKTTADRPDRIAQQQR